MLHTSLGVMEHHILSVIAHKQDPGHVANN
jgi:hypothetical protein